MFAKRCLQWCVAVGIVMFAVGVAQALTIDLVPVGNPGNLPDTRYATPGYGAVGYTYQIGKFDVTAGQYTAFLNAVAATDTYGLYDTRMDVAISPDGCNIKRNGLPGNYTYSVASDWANRPVNIVYWGDAVRFANWLSNGQPTGSQGLSTTEDGSYYVNAATSDEALMAVTRKPNATYVIPTEDEWYKAAYYDPNKGGPGIAGYWDYPTKSDTRPINTVSSTGVNNANFCGYTYAIGSPYYRTEVGAFAGSPSSYGTFDQGGNLWQYTETEFLDGHVGRGGSFYDDALQMRADIRIYGYSTGGLPFDIGFRVASVPEPGSIALLLPVGAIGLLAYAWRRGKGSV